MPITDNIKTLFLCLAVIIAGILFFRKSPEAKISNIKADSYIVDYSSEGDSLSWSDLDRVVIVLGDTVHTFKEVLAELKLSLDDERDVQARMYQYSSNDEIKTLIGLYDPYLKAGDKLASLLSELITNYEGMFKAISLRDEVLYNFYSTKVDELETQRKAIVGNYQQTLEAKQSYAKRALSQ